MSEIKELNDKNYVSFIDFYSDTCPTCQTLLINLPNLAQHYKDEGVVIAKVNAANNQQLSDKFMVRSVPLTVVGG